MVLLEVIIAMTIFMLIGFSLVMALKTTMDAALERNKIDTVLQGLENHLESLHASRVAPMDKDLPDDGSGILYHLTIEPEQMQNQKNQPVTGMYRATITAKWKSNGQEEDRSVTQLIYQP